MKIIDANKEILSTEIVKSAIARFPECGLSEITPDVTARTHPMQRIIWEALGVRSIPPAEDKSMGGCRVITDRWMPKDRIRFEHCGVPMLAIVNLAVIWMGDEDPAGVA